YPLSPSPGSSSLYLLFYYLKFRHSPTSRLFPYTTLFRSDSVADFHKFIVGCGVILDLLEGAGRKDLSVLHSKGFYPGVVRYSSPDRKSTRLNSSHVSDLVCRLLLEKKQ